MEERDQQELQNPDNWDFERAHRTSGMRAARAVVSVAFSREDFERVAGCAEQLGMRTSEFIREAALNRADCHRRLAVLSSFSSSTSQAIFSDRIFPTTRATIRIELSGELRPQQAAGQVLRG